MMPLPASGVVRADFRDFFAASRPNQEAGWASGGARGPVSLSATACAMVHPVGKVRRNDCENGRICFYSASEQWFSQDQTGTKALKP